MGGGGAEAGGGVHEVLEGEEAEVEGGGEGD